MVDERIAAEKSRKRVNKIIMFTSSELRTQIGKEYQSIENHFSKKRPGKSINLDSNISALRLFFTFITDVSSY